MDERKKALTIWYSSFGLIALYFMWVGYSIGKSRQKELIKTFAFPIPDDFTSDETQYFMNEIMEELRKRNFSVTQDEVNALHINMLTKTIKSRTMVDGLFQKLGG